MSNGENYHDKQWPVVIDGTNVQVGWWAPPTEEMVHGHIVTIPCPDGQKCELALDRHADAVWEIIPAHLPAWKARGPQRPGIEAPNA